MLVKKTVAGAGSSFGRARYVVFVLSLAMQMRSLRADIPFLDAVESSARHDGMLW